MKKIHFVPLLLFLILSCELDKDFDYSSNEDQIVLNGLLCPDSLISIKVSKTLPYPNKSNSFPLVENASIKLYENGLYKENLLYSQEKQAYYLEEYPEAGNTYSIEVVVPEYPLISATTTIPEMEEVSACYTPFNIDQTMFRGKIFATVNFSHVNKEDRYWLGAVSDYAPMVFLDSPPFHYYDSTEVKRRWVVSLYSGSSVFDNFNSTSDTGLTSYSFYTRMNESTKDIFNLNVDLFSFETSYFYTYHTIKNLPSYLGLYLVVFNGSPEYDRYLKSTVLNFINSNFENDTPNPFVEPVINYSNVVNGKGIFAGYSQRLLPLHNNPCK